MPEITRFYGIVIKVFFGDHPPPHFHAIYGEYNVLVSIESLEIIEGDFLSSRSEISSRVGNFIPAGSFTDVEYSRVS